METISAELILILALLLLTGFFSMSEIAIISSRKARLKQKADEGNQRYQKVLHLAQNPGPFLSTIQVGITLINILIGALGEATLSESLQKALKTIDWLAPYAGPVSFTLVIIGITLTTLLIAELVPKRIALSNPEGIAVAMIHPIRFFSLLFYPFERLLTFLTEIVLKILRVKDSDGPPVTEEEVKVMLREGREAGVFHQVEQNLVENVFYLDDKGTHTFLTPRIDVVYLEKDEDPMTVRAMILDNEFTHYPVCDGGMDNVIGIVDCKKVLSAMAENRYKDLKDHMSAPIFVPSSVSALKVLTQFKEKNTSMAVVVDEYGGILGIMTLRNILERLLGEVAISNLDIPRIIRRDDGSYLVDGALPFADFAKYFHCEKDYAEEKGDYHTVAGFILQRMGRIPSPANYFIWKTFYFEVLDMDGNRVDKILVRKFEKKIRPSEDRKTLP